MPNGFGCVRPSPTKEKKQTQQHTKTRYVSNSPALLPLWDDGGGMGESSYLASVGLAGSFPKRRTLPPSGCNSGHQVPSTSVTLSTWVRRHVPSVRDILFLAPHRTGARILLNHRWIDNRNISSRCRRESHAESLDTGSGTKDRLQGHCTGRPGLSAACVNV
jgi:hypothetical protein